MCTYVIYSNPGSDDVPLLMATTRDENPKRKTAPAFLWDRDFLFTSPAALGTILLPTLKERGAQVYVDAGIIAPRDEYLGGTFLAQNKHGVIAAVNNREHSPFKDDHKLQRVLGRDSGLRKMPRGGLPLEACSYTTAEEATYALWRNVRDNQMNNPERKYSGFNLVIADPTGAWIITNAKAGDITVDDETRLEYEDIADFSLALWKIPAGKVSMLGGYDLNDERSIRTQKHLQLLSELPIPKFDNIASWHPWLNQMAYKPELGGNPFEQSICQPNPDIYGVGTEGWVTIATHLMLVSKQKQSWFGLEGQLVHGKLPMQVINRQKYNNHPDNWAQVAFSPDSIRAFPSARPQQSMAI